MNIKNHELIALAAGLRQLDSCKSFGGDSGKIRYRIARNIRTLSSVSDAFEATRLALAKELLADRPISEQDPDFPKFRDAWFAFLQQPADELRLFRLPWADLKVDENAIAPTALATLEPIIDGSPE